MKLLLPMSTWHHRWQRGLIAAVLFLGMLGCLHQNQATVAQSSPGTHQSMAPGAMATLTTANSRFGLNLFSQLLRQQPGQNVFISPASVAIALTLTYNGASGTTQTAMAKTLELQGMSLPQLNQAYQELQTTLKNPDPDVQLAIANSLWGAQGEPFKPDFLTQIKTFDQAQVTNVDFSNPSTPAMINAWVNQNTNGKIPTIISPGDVNGSTVFVLANAIYFLGKWTQPFSPEATQPRPFTRLDGTTKPQPLMLQTVKNATYFENDQLQAISLPYGKGRLRMDVFLPRQAVKFSDFTARVTPETWQQWQSQLQQPSRVEVRLGLPRFKLEYDVELRQALEALGMGVAFGGNADFSAMTSGAAQISKVKHKTFLEVNEAGTEAAGATAVIGVRSAPVVQQRVEMTCDRPFLIAIRDSQTNSLLFLGAIVDPQSK